MVPEKTFFSKFFSQYKSMGAIDQTWPVWTPRIRLAIPNLPNLLIWLFDNKSFSYCACCYFSWQGTKFQDEIIPVPE